MQGCFWNIANRNCSSRLHIEFTISFFNENGAGTSLVRFDNAAYAENVFAWLSEPRPTPSTPILAEAPGLVAFELNQGSLLSVEPSTSTVVDECRSR